MTRNEQLEFCMCCKNQKFDMQKGIVCGLTDQHATFHDECPDYVEDPVAKEKHQRHKASRREMAVEEESLGLSSTFGVKNGKVAGQLAIAAAIIWFVGGIAFLDRIFFYPIILLVIGIISWNRGLDRDRSEFE